MGASMVGCCWSLALPDCCLLAADAAGAEGDERSPRRPVPAPPPLLGARPLPRLCDAAAGIFAIL